MPQELPPLRSGEENKFFEALEDRKIIHSSLEELKDALKIVMIKVGLRSSNFPDETEKAILIDHILKEYGGHTCQEIKLAFEMAIAGKLESLNSKQQVITLDPNCYENFSCLYFSEIMNAYRVWAARVYNLLPKEELKQIENKTGIIDQEMEEWINEWKVKINSIDNPTLIPPLFYDWLISKNLLVIENSLKKVYLHNHAVALRQNNLSNAAKSEGEHGASTKELKEFTAMRDAGVFEGREVERLKELAKKISVYYYLKQCQ